MRSKIMSRNGAIAIATTCILFALACGLPTPTATPEPTATWTPISPFPTGTPTATPTVMPTPHFISLPPAEVLGALIAQEQGKDFTYIKLHYVPADTVVWVLFGWPEKEDILYRAVFQVVGGEWTLTGTEPMTTPTPERGRTWPEGEARR